MVKNHSQKAFCRSIFEIVEVRLKKLREDRGLSQNALARELAMSLANIQKIEYGKAKSIPMDTLEKLCLVLDCEIGDLLVITPDRNAQSE
jgi:putative transcriptional regulator